MRSRLSWRRAYVGLGSNLGGPRTQLRRALVEINSLSGTRCLAHSSFYRSPPMGPQDQAEFVNAVACLETVLDPYALLRALQGLERRHRRVRGRRWGPRTLDLDLLVYGEVRLGTRRLTLPHPGVTERNFVLHPLAELEPDLVIPGHGTVSKLAARCPGHGLVRLR